MAVKQDLDYTYSTIDEIFRLSMGESGDFSGAMYQGDFSMTLEEAQRQKHEFITESLHISRNSRILDLGCGWGPFINYAVKNKGASAIGLTLSERQARACQKNGFDVYIKDCKTVNCDDFGTFDAIVSLGAFEHFCSIEQYKAGLQEKIYADFFEMVHSLLPNGARFFLQTMVFGKNMLPYEAIDINATRGSDAQILALMVKQFPGSWLPYGEDMILKTASPFFNVVSKSSGRLDYIETIRQWRKKFRKFNLRKYWLYASLLPSYLTDESFRHRVEIFKVSPNKICFEREIMDHFRIVFEKK